VLLDGFPALGLVHGCPPEQQMGTTRKFVYRTHGETYTFKPNA
jgi:hypothetical protein